MNQEAFLSQLDETRIVEAIRAGESRSRGEIRVHVANGPVPDARRAAEADFVRLGMTATDERNGVLILLAPESQSCAVIGDAGIDALCPPGFWGELADAVATEFRAARFTEGITGAVARVADVLERHFPRRPGDQDRNELPDAISRDSGTPRR